MNIYFVYIYKDPNTHIPFYVGYGKKQRHLFHLNEAKSKPTPKSGEHKLNKIRKLLSNGQTPIIQIIDSQLTKDQACELEVFLISEIGRADLGTGTLLNLTAGGDGVREWSPEQRTKISESRKEIIAAKDPTTGKKFRVHKTDPRWTSGELVGQNLGEVNTNKNGKLTGYIQAKDSSGNFYRVKRDDPRWESGELVGVRKGKPPHPNTIKANNARKGIPKSKEHNQKVSATIKQLKWYCNFETNTVGRFKEGHQPVGFVRISGPHRRTLV